MSSPQEPAGAKERPLVSVVVVNYNGAKHLANCLHSLWAATYPCVELMVVDNGSSDESPAVLNELASTHRDLSTILSPQNLGYAGAVNLALSVAHGSYLAVLNMDLTVDPHWLEPLVDCLEQHQRIGVVCPMVTLADRRHINAVGQDIHVSGLGFNRGLGQLLEKVGSLPFRVSGIQGAAFLISRSLLQRIGGLQASGFLYHEDVNLSWLVQLMGLQLFCVPKSVVHHDYFLSMHPAKLYLLERNRWAMLWTYLRPSTLILLSPILLLTEFLLWGYCVLQGRAFVRAKARSSVWVWRQRHEIKERRAWAEMLRGASDWAVLRNLCWIYHGKQLLTLGRERDSSRRQPAGGIPEEMRNL